MLCPCGSLRRSLQNRVFHRRMNTSCLGDPYRETFTIVNDLLGSLIGESIIRVDYSSSEPRADNTGKRVISNTAENVVSSLGRSEQSLFESFQEASAQSCPQDRLTYLLPEPLYPQAGQGVTIIRYVCDMHTHLIISVFQFSEKIEHHRSPSHPQGR